MVDAKAAPEGQRTGAARSVVADSVTFSPIPTEFITTKIKERLQVSRKDIKVPERSKLNLPPNLMIERMVPNHMLNN